MRDLSKMAVWCAGILIVTAIILYERQRAPVEASRDPLPSGGHWGEEIIETLDSPYGEETPTPAQ